MQNFFIKAFTAFNAWLLRITRGRLGSKLGRQTVLLLHTLGSRSGQERVTPIAYFQYEGGYLIVASNWGREQHAAWYWNLKHTPRARLEINGKSISVLSHEAQGEEYQRLWDYVTRRHPPYLDYQKMTSRRIPVMVFEPLEDAGA